MYARRYLDVKKAQDKAKKEKENKKESFRPKYKSIYNSKIK